MYHSSWPSYRTLASRGVVGQYSAYLPALDTAYRVGHIVVDTLVADWPEDRDHLPAAAR